MSSEDILNPSIISSNQIINLKAKIYDRNSELQDINPQKHVLVDDEVNTEKMSPTPENLSGLLPDSHGGDLYVESGIVDIVPFFSTDKSIDQELKSNNSVPLSSKISWENLANSKTSAGDELRPLDLSLNVNTAREGQSVHNSCKSSKKDNCSKSPISHSDAWNIPGTPRTLFEKIFSKSSNNSFSKLGDKKKFDCDSCPKSYNFKSGLQRHTIVHSTDRPFSCYMCENNFKDKKTLKRHIRTHIGEKTHICDTCGKAFLEKKNLMQHLRSHLDERPYTCDICQKSFKANRDLTIHLATHSDIKPFLCEVCKKRFHSQISLNKHRRYHSVQEETKQFICGICSREFKNNSALRVHVFGHSGVKRFPCNICEKKFTRKNGLKRHLLSHTGEKPFECEKCHKLFSDRCLLKSHVRIHSGERPFVCEICRLAFRSRSCLNGHFRTHFGERPFVCSICQESFTRKNSLKRHLLTRHSIPAELHEQHIVGSGSGTQCDEGVLSESVIPE